MSASSIPFSCSRRCCSSSRSRSRSFTSINRNRNRNVSISINETSTSAMRMSAVASSTGRRLSSSPLSLSLSPTTTPTTWTRTWPSTSTSTWKTLSTRNFASTTIREDDDDAIDRSRPRWLEQMNRRAQSSNNQQQPMDSQKVYRYLKLENYKEKELKERFQSIATTSTSTIATATTIAPTIATTTTTTDEKNDNDNDNENHDVDAVEIVAFDRDKLRSYMSQTIREEEEKGRRRRKSPYNNNNNNNSNNNKNSNSIENERRIEFLRSEYIEAETNQLWNFLIADKKKETIVISTPDDHTINNDNDHTNNNNNITITKHEFVTNITNSATSIDKQRLWPLTLSMVMIGLSVGVTTPAFPFVVQNLGLTTGEYGMVVSAFALTKLFGNIPFAVLVERNGRKPYLVYSMIAISTGVGCIGLASGFEELYTCRLITGLGVAGLSCAATMTVTDISTPLNRASSFAPISAGFAAGTAMGPALGGILIDQIGVNPTFYLVGGSFLMLGGVNSLLLDETLVVKRRGGGGRKFPWYEEQQEQQKQHQKQSQNQQQNQNQAVLVDMLVDDNGKSSTSSSSSSKTLSSTVDSRSSSDKGKNNNNNNNTEKEEDEDSIKNAFQSALGQWVPLLSEAPVRNVCIINGFYWVALAGSQMTLLPLILTDPAGLAMTATQVGQVYMGMSIVQVLGNPLFARVVDSVGTVPGIVAGCTMISSAMFALPYCDPNHLEQMAAVLGVWAAGSSLLSTSPIAHISDRVDDAKRAQAIALLRTSGDVGFLVGASTMGLLSDWAGGWDTAMQSSSAILATATSWYVVRNIAYSRAVAAAVPTAAAASCVTKSKSKLK